ncbi:hypothetical protein [Parasphingorhabdus sp.]
MHVNLWIVEQSIESAIRGIAATRLFLKKPGQKPFFMVENSLLAEPDERD